MPGVRKRHRQWQRDLALVRRAYSHCDFAFEAFAQQSIHHQLGLNHALGWCGVLGCTGQQSLLARNPAETFDRDWWVVGVAMDRGTIRHDLFPKLSYDDELVRVMVRRTFVVAIV
ncbi:MAG TPA: hypothetical protein VNS88_11250 [Nitrospiraceae bacterium]|nr:hypothetical protein [Nitrospiraceae bacterium]